MAGNRHSGFGTSVRGSRLVARGSSPVARGSSLVARGLRLAGFRDSARRGRPGRAPAFGIRPKKGCQEPFLDKCRSFKGLRNPVKKVPGTFFLHYKKLPLTRSFFDFPDVCAILLPQSDVARGAVGPGLLGGAERTRPFSLRRSPWRPARVRTIEDVRGRSAARPISPFCMA